RPQRSVAAVVFGVLSGVLFLMLLVGGGLLSWHLNKTDVRQERALQQEQVAQQQALQAQREAEQAAMRARGDANARQDFERRLQEEANRRQEAERMRNEAERQRQDVQNQLRILEQQMRANAEQLPTRQRQLTEPRNQLGDAKNKPTQAEARLQKAEFRAQQAEAKLRTVAKEQRDAGGEAAHYADRIALAYWERQAGNVPRAASLLRDCPEALRGWEWRYLHGLSSPQVVTLAQGDRTLPLTTLAVSPDGQLLAAGATGQSLVVRDVVSGKELFRVDGNDTIRSVAFNPNGKHLAARCFGKQTRGQIKIWEVVTGKVVRSAPTSIAGLDGLAYSPDGSRLATFGPNSPDRTIRLLDASTLEELVSLEGHATIPQTLAFSP